MKTIISTEVKYDRRRVKDREDKKERRRNEQGLTPKQQELQDLKYKVLELKEKGLSYRKIAEKLSVTLGKVQRLLK